MPGEDDGDVGAIDAKGDDVEFGAHTGAANAHSDASGGVKNVWFGDHRDMSDEPSQDTATRHPYSVAAGRAPGASVCDWAEDFTTPVSIDTTEPAVPHSCRRYADWLQPGFFDEAVDDVVYLMNATVEFTLLGARGKRMGSMVVVVVARGRCC